MKNHLITATTLCALLVNSGCNGTGDTSKTTKTETTKSSSLVADKTTGRSFSTADFLDDEQVTIEAHVGFVDSFAIMGECEEGQKARKEIEGKRDFAAKEIQDESKAIEKAKADYVSKSTTMSDSARDKEEKRLVKMERELKNFVAEKEEELKADMQAATEMLAQSLETGVVKLAEKEKLDVILDKMTGRAIYVSAKFDFTDKAITEVNKNYEVKLAQNKKAESSVKVANNSKTTGTKAANVNA